MCNVIRSTGTVYASGNVLYCRPVSTGGFHADNAGIGNIPAVSTSYIILDTDCDPTSADYGKVTTSYTDGDWLALSSAGSAGITIDADSGNATETDNASVRMTQDGQGSRAWFEMAGDLTNDLRIGVASTSSPAIVFSTDSSAGWTGNERVRIRNDGRLAFGGSTGPQLVVGSGDPESVITAPIGSLYLRTDGGAGTTLYVKQSGTGNTGWAGK